MRIESEKNFLGSEWTNSCTREDRDHKRKGESFLFISKKSLKGGVSLNVSHIFYYRAIQTICRHYFLFLSW